MTIKAATMQKDVYKEYHVSAYHPDVSEVYVNYTSRSGKYSNVPGNDVVFVGLQYFIKDYLINEWNETFFSLSKEEAVRNHKRILSAALGYNVNVEYLEKLHNLGYLPLKIKALPEGSLVPYGVAPLTIVNTVKGFQWLPNMIETVLSAEKWPIQTSATTSHHYFKNFKKYFEQTGAPMGLLPFMGHDFSFRGMFGRQAAAMSGFGHLCSGFAGTDTIPAILFAEKYYNADVDKELVGCSVDATEHSVTCSWLDEGEIEFFKYLMTEQTPTGILSVVSDTWDFWKLVTEYLPLLKDSIMSRDGKLVIRPDSGDPVKILTGYTKLSSTNYECEDDVVENAPYENLEAECVQIEGVWYSCTWINEDDFEVYMDSPLQECEVKGLVECLWGIFGGTTTDKDYKLLDDHIGAIYGDSITLERQVQICERLIEKGFAPVVVLGIGSYTYQHVTRDTHGSAVKATNVIKKGVSTPIFKDPKTDRSKKSAKGLLRVEYENGKYVMYDEQTKEQEQQGELKAVFCDGNLLYETSLSEIRKRLS